MIPIISQPMSPSMASNMDSGKNMNQMSSALHYSPLSPIYSNSPLRGYSPSSKHANNISPAYSYNSLSGNQSSPNYSGSGIYSF